MTTRCLSSRLTCHCKMSFCLLTLISSQMFKVFIFSGGCLCPQLELLSIFFSHSTPLLSVQCHFHFELLLLLKWITLCLNLLSSKNGVWCSHSWCVIFLISCLFDKTHYQVCIAKFTTTLFAFAGNHSCKVIDAAKRNFS